MNDSNQETGTAGRWLSSLLSYAIGLACLYWVFHGVPLRQLLDSLAGVRWWWLVPAVILDLAVYLLAAWEWRLLLSPVAKITFWQTTQALFAGRFANDVLPVHAGYIIRLYLAARWSGSTLAMVVPSLLIERAFDSLWLALGIGLTSLFFPLPPEYLRMGEVLGGLILVAIGFVIWLVLRNTRPKASSAVPQRWPGWKLIRKSTEFLHKVAEGVHSLGRSRLVLLALALSVLKLVVQCLTFLALLSAYGFTFSIWVRLALFLIAYIGISLPSTPAAVGVFQLFCTAGLRFFGVPRPAATGFALLAFVVLTVPLALAGFWAITRVRLTVPEIRRELTRWRRS